MTAHLFASTVLALAAVVAACALPRRGAAFRHAILLAAILRFALPTSWLIKAGSSLTRFIPERSHGVGDLSSLLLHQGVVSISAAPVSSNSSVLILWAAGSILCFAVWMWRAGRPLGAVRPPTAAESAPVPVRIVAVHYVPGAAGWLRPYIILPDGLSDALTSAELAAVIAHEVAHIRRRDNLWAALAHGVVCIFWFHPLLWFLERRLLAERETACDELVLAQGTEAGDYVSAIAKICRMGFTPAVYAGVTGSDLQRRMDHILSMTPHRISSSFPRAAAGVLLTLIAILPVAGGLLSAQAPAPRADISGVLADVESLLAQGRQEEAIGILQRGIAADPANRDLHLALGNVAVRTRRFELALAEFRKLMEAVANDPKSGADLYLRMGETYRRMGDDESALAALRKARELEPGNVKVASVTALVLEHAGHRDEATRMYLEVLSRDEKNGVALNNVAYLLAEAGELDRALGYARTAKQSMPDTSEVDDTLGWIYLKRKQTDEAIALFRANVERAIENAAYRSHLVLALDQRGDTAPAIGELKSLLRAPSSAAADRRIRELLADLR